MPVRILDALHLAAADYLRSHGFVVHIATYDPRMQAAADALGFPAWAGATGPSTVLSGSGGGRRS